MTPIEWIGQEIRNEQAGGDMWDRVAPLTEVLDDLISVDFKASKINALTIEVESLSEQIRHMSREATSLTRDRDLVTRELRKLQGKYERLVERAKLRDVMIEEG